MVQYTRQVSLPYLLVNIMPIIFKKTTNQERGLTYDSTFPTFFYICSELFDKHQIFIPDSFS